GPTEARRGPGTGGQRLGTTTGLAWHPPGDAGSESSGASGPEASVRLRRERVNGGEEGVNAVRPRSPAALQVAGPDRPLRRAARGAVRRRGRPRASGGTAPGPPSARG